MANRAVPIESQAQATCTRLKFCARFDIHFTAGTLAKGPYYEGGWQGPQILLQPSIGSAKLLMAL
eukprot:scaffold176222_cov29-Tisochrysis_lutea.AAC.12